MSRFEFLLFSTNTELIREAASAGVEGIIVDWENAGKDRRQQNANTQINFDTPDDLRRVRRATRSRVICRVNGFHPGTGSEVDVAIACGADEIFLPMVRTVAEVEEVLRFISDRCELGILVETVEAVDCVQDLTLLPLSRIYVGLNDLAIQRGTRNIFTAVSDGTVERVRADCTVPFGFAGLTLPDRGNPIPCRLLMGEMMRLNTDFTFLRRSFHADVVGRDMTTSIRSMRTALSEAAHRTSEAVERDRRELLAAIEAWPVRPGPKTNV